MREQLISRWQLLSYDTRYAIWLGGGVLLLVMALYAFYRLFRYLLGYRLFRGVWFNEEQYQLLIERLIEHQRLSPRILANDELQLLRNYMRART